MRKSSRIAYRASAARTSQTHSAEIGPLLAKLPSEEAQAGWEEFLLQYNPALYQTARTLAHDEDDVADCFVHICDQLAKVQAGRCGELRHMAVGGGAESLPRLAPKKARSSAAIQNTAKPAAVGAGDGVIGMDVLRMCRGMTINFETMQVVFRTDGRSEQTATGPLLVRLEVQGEPLRLVLDTGARDIFLYQDRVRDHAHGLTWEHQAARTRVGWMMVKITPRLGLPLGERELEGSAFLMEKAPSSLPVEIDGFLRLGVLNARYVELDFEANMLRYVKKEPSARARAGSNENGRGRPRAETPEARIALSVAR